MTHELFRAVGGRAVAGRGWLVTAGLALFMSTCQAHVGENHDPFYPTYRCDMLELNHYVDGDTGKPIFTQLMVMYWDEQLGDWACHKYTVWPVVSIRGNVAYVTIGAGRPEAVPSGSRIDIEFRRFREIWSTYDREVWDRRTLSSQWRRGAWSRREEGKW